MFVEVCLILRIVLNNEGGGVLLKNISVLPCDATRVPQKDDTHKATPETQKEDSILRSQIRNANIKPLWAYKPARESQADGHYESLPVPFRAPHTVTKLAKTLSYGFDPFFSKDHFEPFERRPKPVTLVGLKRNGVVPRKMVKKNSEPKSAEVAELQSPFNDISNFWVDAAENLE